MKIGYARVSTQDQNLEMQIDSLNQYGCELIYQEKSSGATTDRKELEKMLSHLRKGDVVVIWKLDRISRTLKDLISLVNLFKEKQVGFVSLNDPVDTTNPQGILIFNIFASLAQFERENLILRTKAGLASARARGRVGGRPSGISKEANIKASAAVEMYKQLTPVNQISKSLDISKATLYKYLRLKGVEIKS
jgi:DNA invertase Pin-like site-specific DNA recombinase